MGTIADPSSGVGLSKGFDGMNASAEPDHLRPHASDHGAEDASRDAGRGVPKDDFNAVADVEPADARRR
jgi:hypothetical protein